MKIAVIAPTALPSRRANTIQVMKMAQGFRQAGHAVEVLVPQRDPAAAPVAWEELATHYGLSEPFPVNWLPARSVWRGYDFGRRAVSQARRGGADLVYTRHPQAAAAASLSGLPAILEVHDLPGGEMGPLLLRGFLRGRGAQRLVVITEALLTSLKKHFSLPPAPFTLVAPDGVDLERFRELPGRQAARQQLAQFVPLPPDAFLAGYTGSLYRGRGAEQIVELAGRLPEVHFLLAGGRDADVERLRETVQDRSLDNLTVAGFVPNADLPLYQAACDVLLMPYQEQVAASSGGDIAPFLSPMKVFEYLAAGRPILSSDLPVLREILNEETAVLLPPGDLAAWEQALRSLQDDTARQDALGARGRLEAEKYSWQARAERVLEGFLGTARSE